MKNKKAIGVVIMLTTIFASINAIIFCYKLNNKLKKVMKVDKEEVKIEKCKTLIESEIMNGFEGIKIQSNLFVLMSELASILTPKFVKKLIPYSNILNMLYVIVCSAYIRTVENIKGKESFFKINFQFIK